MPDLIEILLEARNRIELIKRDRPLTTEEKERQAKIDAQLMELGGK